MSLSYSFVGKKVLITGGGDGIGRQLVQRFHDDGALVYTVDKLPELIQKLKKELPNVTAEVVDLADWDATRKVVQSFGVIDHLVNNAGIMMPQKIMDITQDAAKLIFDVNLAAPINVTQVVAKGLIDASRKGSIVNISSIGARRGKGSPVYNATKAGLENLTKSMALELGAHNIRVNCILPGVVETPKIQKWDPAIKNAISSAMIVKRLVSTNEVADLVMFLLSPLASMIVGEAVVVDGGYLVG